MFYGGLVKNLLIGVIILLISLSVSVFVIIEETQGHVLHSKDTPFVQGSKKLGGRSIRGINEGSVIFDKNDNEKRQKKQKNELL